MAWTVGAGSASLEVNSNIFMKNSLTAITVGLLSISVAPGAVSYTGTTISQTFTGYDGTAGPVGWDANGFSSGTGFSENRGASTGGVGTGGTYAFDIGGGNVALGVQPGGSDFTPGYYQLEVTNDSGAPIVGVRLGYDGLFFNDQARGNSLDLSYSLDGTTFTPIAAASFTSPEVADALGWTTGVSYAGDTAVTVPNGSSFFLRWDGDDSTGGASRDEFAIDNVTFAAVPEPSSVLLGSLALLGLLRRKR
ncbi:PEP-CTERM sorting domain-containing protein [Akkermansiaceae bacterium]|nr:PEP-CTERM sorting domain-containing protein [Akkermansiaceae bacterium]